MLDMDNYHRIYGKHSNIPECCIEFFIKEWPNLVSTGERYQHDNLQDTVEGELGKTFGYIPCPKCLKEKHWQKIHLCKRGECNKIRNLLKKETGYTFPYDKLEAPKCI